MVTVETARVFRAGRRRFFSKRAAIRHCAKPKFSEKYPCECDRATGYTCWAHREEGLAVMARYQRALVKKARGK